MKARIFDIKRFAVHDGDGIRTTVFFKGCPLKCVWCHNPEGIEFKPQTAYYKNKCVSCGECVSVCPENAHVLRDNVHVFERDKCVACGKCANACFSGALALYGKEVTESELMPLLLEDRDFYEASGGGVTLSGGECLSQADFCAALLKSLKKEGVNTAVDTCGFASKESFDKVMPYVDSFLYDIKAMDEDVHIRCTGKSNKPVLDNLKYIDACGKNVEIRIPFVPGFNDDQTEKIAAFLGGLKNVTGIRLLPYHDLAGSKYDALGAENTLPKRIPDKDALLKAEKILSAAARIIK